jgi:hypothetical protein
MELAVARGRTGATRVNQSRVDEMNPRHVEAHLVMALVPVASVNLEPVQARYWHLRRYLRECCIVGEQREAEPGIKALIWPLSVLDRYFRASTCCRRDLTGVLPVPLAAPTGRSERWSTHQKGRIHAIKSRDASPRIMYLGLTSD